MAKTQLIITIPDETVFSALKPQVQELLSVLGANFDAGFHMPGTIIHEDRRPLLMQMTPSGWSIEYLIGLLEAADPHGWIMEAAQEARLRYAVDENGEPTGEVLGVFKPVPADFVRFLPDLPVYDEDDETIIGYEPQQLGAPLATFQGFDQWVWESAL